MAPPLTEDNAFGRLKRDPTSPSGWRDGPTGSFPSKDLIDLVKKQSAAFGAAGQVSGSRSPKINKMITTIQTQQNLTTEEAEDATREFFLAVARGEAVDEARRIISP